jgi:N-acetylglucosamine kinase-like BadF-type ATPase
MATVLGVEGGGSHCHAVVAESAGTVLGVGANDDPANWDDVGIQAAGASIRSCVREALAAARIAAAGIAASVIALAGIDFPMDELRLSGIPASLELGEPFRIVNDAFAALRAGTDDDHGIVVVAGTGSVVAGRNAAGDEFRTLGMGPLLGDSGSASEVSEAAVSAVAAAYLGRGPETGLTELVRERSGAESVVDFLEGVSRGRIDDSVFSVDVVRAAADGDDVARSILAEAGRTLGETAVHVIRTLGMEEEAFDLVLAGGMFRAETPYLVEAVEAVVRPVAEKITPRPLEDPPVVGSVMLAIDLAGKAPAHGVRSTLAEGIAAALGHPRSFG